MAEKVVDRVKDVAQDEAERLKNMTVEAVESKAYIYPFLGIYYFVTHDALWRPLFSRLAHTMTLSLGVTTLLFVVAYLPQAAAMAFTSGPIAPLSAALLTLSESSTLTNVLSRTFLVDGALTDTFDGTLVSKDCVGILSEGRQLKAGNDPIAKLGSVLKKPFVKFSPNALIRYFIYLPLNFIPVIGTVAFIILSGKRNGPSSHTRYFQLKKWSKSQQDAYVEKHRGAYTSFGIVAFLLEMIPFVNLIFAFTNTVGAALWAVDLEKGGSTAPHLREQAKKAE